MWKGFYVVNPTLTLTLQFSVFQLIVFDFTACFNFVFSLTAV